jgi:hypothetical protein
LKIRCSVLWRIAFNIHCSVLWSIANENSV